MPEEHYRGYFLPEVITGHAFKTVCFDIPDVAEYRQAFWGKVYELTSPAVWRKESYADARNLQAAQYWEEILYTNVSRFWEEDGCAPSTCRTYPPSAGFIQWFPNDPFLTPDFVGDGYNNPAWYLATTASNIAYGSSPGDAITSLDRFPPGSLPTVIPSSGLPRFRINVSGAGTVKATLVNLFGGSLIQTTTDDDILTLKFVDVSRDTISAPPETQEELTVEFTFDTPGAHHIDFIVVSWANTSIPFLHHGGGLRRVELCGFETMPVVTPPFRFTEGCGLEYYNGEEWLPVDGWSEFAPACFTGPAGTNGTNGTNGNDAQSTMIRDTGNGQLQVSPTTPVAWTDVPNAKYLHINADNDPLTSTLDIDPNATSLQALRLRYPTVPSVNPLEFLINSVRRAFINQAGAFVSTQGSTVNQTQLISSGDPSVLFTRNGQTNLLVFGQSQAAPDHAFDFIYDSVMKHRMYKDRVKLFKNIFIQDDTSTSRRDAALLRTVWSNSADATRESQVVLETFQQANAVEILRGGGLAAAPKVGFLGATPVVRQPVSGDALGNQLLLDIVAALSSFGLINVTSVVLGEIPCCDEPLSCFMWDFDALCGADVVGDFSDWDFDPEGGGPCIDNRAATPATPSGIVCGGTESPIFFDGRLAFDFTGVTKIEIDYWIFSTGVARHISLYAAHMAGDVLLRSEASGALGSHTLTHETFVGDLSEGIRVYAEGGIIMTAFRAYGLADSPPTSIVCPE